MKKIIQKKKAFPTHTKEKKNNFFSAMSVIRKKKTSFFLLTAMSIACFILLNVSIGNPGLPYGNTDREIKIGHVDTESPILRDIHLVKQLVIKLSDLLLLNNRS